MLRARLASSVSLWFLVSCAPAVGPLFTSVDAGESTDTPDAGNTAVRPGMRLQYQLQGALDPAADADVFVVDLFETTPTQLAQLHTRGRVVVAYIAAGSYEPWRPDVDTLPDAVIGDPLPRYPDEAWLDIRATSVRQLMVSRLARAASNGFDGVLLASLEGYLTQSGHDLTASDQLDYNRWLAEQASARGLAVGVSSDWPHAEQLASRYDFAIHLNCLANSTCAQLAPFRARGHAVFDLEVSRDVSATCARAADLALPVTLKNSNFDAWLAICP
ncbi:MAG: hypothetical protein RLZZ450_6192 [Pseudomonadota bacterium]|jgi:hypothetical protein